MTPEQRIARLETQVRRQRRWLLVGAAGTLAFAAASFQDPAPIAEVVRARRFEVIGSEGVPIVELGAEEGDGNEGFIDVYSEGKRTDDRPRIPNVSITSLGGAGQVDLWGPRLQGEATLSVEGFGDDWGGTLWLGTDSVACVSARALPTGGGMLHVTHPEGDEGLFVRTGPSPSVEVRGKNGDGYAEFRATDDGAGELVLRNAEGEETVLGPR